MRKPRQDTFEDRSEDNGTLGDGHMHMDRPITRRKMLGGVLLATAGTASLAGLSGSTVARAATPTGAAVVTTKTITRGGHKIIMGPILAPDGFPQASIQGILVGVRSPYCLVNAGNSSGTSVVPVTVLPSTQVLAGGAMRNGVLNALSVGDALFIFTAILESGERIAIKMEQNPRIYKVAVSAIAGSRIDGTTLPSDPTPGVRLQLVVNALTKFPPSGVPQVGSNIQVATISDSPSRRGQIVAMNMNTLGP